MTKRSFKTLMELFRENLRNIYEQSEIDALFYRLMIDLFNLERYKIVSEINKAVSETVWQKSLAALKRLENSEPLQYITGKAFFCNLELTVNTSTLIPRPETEELVYLCLKTIPQNAQIIDIGTGSGAIALAIKKHCPWCKITGIDISAPALKTAAKNAQKLNLQVEFIQQDIFSLPEIFYQTHCDIIISNPPYVRNSEKQQMHSNVINFEPHQALFVDDQNPLIYYCEITKIASRKLSKSGILWVEINESLSEETARIFKKHFKRIEIFSDFREKPRFIKATHLK